MMNSFRLLTLWFVSTFLFVTIAISKDKYPVGGRANWHEPEYRIGSFQNMHKIFASREVENGQNVYELPKNDLGFNIKFKFRDKFITLNEYAKRQNASGLLVIKDDKVIYENYLNGANEKSKFISWSVSKSIVASLIGVAIEEGLIKSVKDPVINYIPELKATAYKDTKIIDLLQMRSGVRFREVFSADPTESDLGPWWEFAMARNQISLNDGVKNFPKSNKPGQRFSYSSADSQILGWLLKTVTGKSISEYTSEKIWKHIGAEDKAYWLVDKDNDKGIEATFCCLNATLRDYGRFGLLALHQGKVNGEEVIPVDWMKESTSPSKEIGLRPGQIRYGSPLGYGYQWWVTGDKDGSFLAKGLFGQFIYVIPKRNLVIVQQSVWKSGSSIERELEALKFFKTVAQQL